MFFHWIFRFGSKNASDMRKNWETCSSSFFFLPHSFFLFFLPSGCKATWIVSDYAEKGLQKAWNHEMAATQGGRELSLLSHFFFFFFLAFWWFFPHFSCPCAYIFPSHVTKPWYPPRSSKDLTRELLHSKQSCRTWGMMWQHSSRQHCWICPRLCKGSSCRAPLQMQPLLDYQMI